MRRRTVAVWTAAAGVTGLWLATTTAVTASAASTGGIAVQPVAARSTAVSRCDVSGMAVAPSLVPLASLEDGYRLDAVVLSGVPGCAGRTARATVRGGADEALVEVSVTVAADGTARLDLPVGSTVGASSWRGTAVTVQ